MMPSDLTEIDDRLSWCQNKTVQLGETTTTWLETSKEVRVITLGSLLLAQIRITQPLPNSIKIDAGAIVHEARASLDALACALAVRNHKSVNGVYFPISNNKSVFEDDGEKKIKKLSDADKTRIRDQKPYGGGNDFLYGMHVFDRDRKHRRLNTTFSGVDGFGINNGNANVIQGPLNATLGNDWKTVAVFGPGTNCDITLIPNIRFAEPPELATLELINGVHRFTNEVKAIVDLFRHH